MNQKRPIAIDLFAGVGGMTLGFEQAGFDVLGSVEIDPIHCAAHHYNFPFWTTICSDISIINAKTIRNLSCIGNREIDVVFGGPPCQGFSLIGKRNPKDNRNNLIKHFIRLVIELQPKYFVIENVPGMATKNNQAFLINSNLKVLPNFSDSDNLNPTRLRQLLLNKNELNQIKNEIQLNNYTIIPLKIYVKKSYLKIEIAIAKGKNTRDKRLDIKTREWERNKKRILKKQ